MSWLGPKTYTDLPEIHRSHSVFLNLSNTASLDKVILEAVFSGIPVVTCNQSGKEIAGVFKTTLDVSQITETIQEAEHAGVSIADIQKAIDDHGIERLIKKIVELLQNVK